MLGRGRHILRVSHGSDGSGMARNRPAFGAKLSDIGMVDVLAEVVAIPSPHTHDADSDIHRLTAPRDTACPKMCALYHLPVPAFT